MRGAWKGLIALLLVVFSLPPAAIGIAGLVYQHKMQSLRERGREIAGTVTALYISPKNHNRHVGYSYSPIEFSHQPDKTVSAEDLASEVEYRGLAVGGAVPVVYDPRKPDRSALRSSLDQPQQPKRSLLGLSPQLAALSLFVLIPAGILSFILRIYFREKWLLSWGKATGATIIGEVEYSGRSTASSRVLYMFKDQSGNTIHGEQASIPAARDPRPDFIEYRARFLHNPTVLFAPGNSAKHMLYPGTIAELRQ